jgi:hypothetical protein
MNHKHSSRTQITTLVDAVVCRYESDIQELEARLNRANKRIELASVLVDAMIISRTREKLNAK